MTKRCEMAQCPLTCQEILVYWCGHAYTGCLKGHQATFAARNASAFSFKTSKTDCCGTRTPSVKFTIRAPSEDRPKVDWDRISA